MAYEIPDFGNPTIEEAVESLRDQHIRELLAGAYAVDAAIEPEEPTLDEPVVLAA